MSAVPPFTAPNFSNLVEKPGVNVPDVSVSPVELAMSDTQDGVSPSSAMLRFPEESIQFGTLFRFVKYDYQSQKTNTKFITSMNGASISLPLPMQLQMQLGMNYAGVDTGILGFATKAGAQIAEGLRTSNTSLTEAGAELLNDAGNTAQYALRKFASNKLLGGASGEAAIDQLLGNVINPFNVATFRNVSSRAYQLSFFLIATSKDESDKIKQICDAFMYHSLPYKTKGAQPVQGQTYFLNMPDEVEISYYGTQYLYQFARAAITSVSVDYAPFGQPSFFGTSKAPTAVILNLGIQEIQQLDRSAFQNYKDTTPAVDEVANTASASDIFQPSNLGG